MGEAIIARVFGIELGDMLKIFHLGDKIRWEAPFFPVANFR